MNTYQQVKVMLKGLADEEKRLHKKDKPMIRMFINDMADSLCKDIDRGVLREEYSEAKAEQYKNWLHDYACNLHPKNQKL